MRYLLFILLFISTETNSQTQKWAAIITSQNAFEDISDDGNGACLSMDGNETLFVWGGTNNITVFNTMYSSVNNGVTWNNLGAASWSIRNASASFVKGGKIYMCGGKNMTDVLLDSWTFDGSTYTQLTSGMTGFGSTRVNFAFDQDEADTFYVASGGNATDVIWSVDGINWSVRSTLPSDLQDNTGASMCKFNGVWYLKTGYKGSTATYPGKLYKSTDNLRTFSLVATDNIFAGRWGTIISTTDAIIFIRGENSNTGGNIKGLYFTQTPEVISSYTLINYSPPASHATPMFLSLDKNTVFTYCGNLRNDSYMITRTDRR